MAEYSGTIRPDEDPMSYRGYDSPLDKELSRLRTETANHILDVRQRVTALQDKVSHLITLCWVLLLLAVASLAASGLLLWRGWNL